MTDDEELAARRREFEERARGLRYFRQSHTAEDMLIERKANEAGYFGSFAYHGGPFDEQRYRLVRGGWDHQHCYICYETIFPGDPWWAAEPPDEIGLCLACHTRLFGDGPAQTGSARLG